MTYRTYSEYVKWMIGEQYVESMHSYTKPDWYLALRLKDLSNENDNLWLNPLAEEVASNFMAEPGFDCTVSLLHKGCLVVSVLTPLLASRKKSRDACVTSFTMPTSDRPIPG